jgi:homoserine dehydrogenase
MEIRPLRLGFAGFGNVGRALARLLLERRAELEETHGLAFVVTLLSSARRGALVEPRGIDLARALREGWSAAPRLLEAIEQAPIDLLFEATPLDPAAGEPALAHARAALDRGISVVTANKGPVAFGMHDLVERARRSGAGFRFESAVADCLPVFNLFEAAFPVGRLRRFRGVLNSTSNHVLQAIARGDDAGAAIAEMQRRGLAEADPSHDLDGWDQAVKAVILTNVLMGRDLRPADVERTALTDVDPAWLRAEEGAGRSVRLMAEADRDGRARVRAVPLERGDFLASLRETSLGISFEIEAAGTINVSCVEPGVEQTAYGMLADLVAIRQGRLMVPARDTPRGR